MGFILKLFGSNPLGISLYRILSYPHSYRIALVRLFLMLRPKIRPHYRVCLFEAAKMAHALGYDRISVIEFGVAGGNGLLALEKYAPKIERRFGVTIDIYGFDMGDGVGLPETQDPRDMPYFWAPGFYKMNHAHLASRLRRSKLILGNMSETVPAFILDTNTAAIGAVFVDVDYCSSSVVALQIFKRPLQNWLPRVLCYFDDVEVCNEFQGERAAIVEFNATCNNRKIARTQGHHEDVLFGTFSSKIYTLHDFSHAQYNVFIGGAAAAKLEL